MQFREYKHIVPHSYIEKERLSKYIIGKFPQLESGSSAKKAVLKGKVSINGRLGVTGDWVNMDDVIEYKSYFDKPQNVFQRKIVFLDEYLMVINKPPGLITSGNAKTLQSELYSFPSSSNEDALFYPYLVHRLDRQTSGLILAARTMECRRELGCMIDNNELVKEYSLIVEGYFDASVNLLSDDIDGKSAITEVLSVKHLITKNPSSYIRVRLHTGRTHQIRKHFWINGNPIVGDDKYNNEGLSFGRGLFLMADSLSFVHPLTKQKVELNDKLHNKFLKYL